MSEQKVTSEEIPLLVWLHAQHGQVSVNRAGDIFMSNGSLSAPYTKHAFNSLHRKGYVAIEERRIALTNEGYALLAVRP